MNQWRSRFQFFEKEQVKEEGALTLEKIVITCSASGQGRLIFGDADGFLNFVERDFQKVVSFKAYEHGVAHLCQLKQSNYLLTVGNDEESITPVVKVWNPDKMDNKTGNPILMKTVKVQPPMLVTALAATDDLSMIAVGLANGLVILIRDIMKDKNPKQVPFGKELGIPVTGLGFKEQSKSNALFVVTLESVAVWHISNKDSKKEELDDSKGCGMGCAVMNTDAEMVIGRNEAVYFYEPDGIGPCFGFEGEKKLLSWFRSYLVVVGQDTKDVKVNTLNIYDLKNKFIAYSETRFQNVTHVVSEWGYIYVLTGDGKIYQLEEKDTQTKLETLFKRNLYDVAINLAQTQNYDPSSVADIFRRYGDHLYSKGEFDRAISQYTKTIGRLEPSYVIRKFLDAQRIHNLTLYLQALHEKGLANPDHTTLLFNCYTKLKDEKKLDEFIKKEADFTFEIETAIKACRQAGYFQHSLYLAKKHNQHEWYLKILLEDVKQFNEALVYISTLDFFEAEKNMKKYGKGLVTNLPDQTTSMLMKLCTDYIPSKSPTSKQEEATNTTSSFGTKKLRASADEFIHIFVNQPEWLSIFLEFIVSNGNASSLAYNTLLELYLRNETGFTIPGSQLLVGKDEINPTSESNEKKKQRLDKAFKLLTNPESKYEDDYALVLCKIHKFREGLLFLYEKLALYHEIVEYYMDNNENENVIKGCKKYSDKDPNLWVQVLTYFVHKSEDCHKEITEVLGYIDRDNLLPPLLVVQILSQRSQAPLSLIKDYIVKRLQVENQQIAEDARQIRSYSEETKKMRNEIQDIKSSARVFQSNKCSYCQNALDLPAVHFLCMHSFHQRCLGENENECLICAPQNKTIREMKRANEANAGQHDQFFKQLEGSVDGFATVADYFGRGIVNRVVLLSEKEAPVIPKGREREALLDG